MITSGRSSQSQSTGTSSFSFRARTWTCARSDSPRVANVLGYRLESRSTLRYRTLIDAADEQHVSQLSTDVGRHVRIHERSLRRSATLWAHSPWRDASRWRVQTPRTYALFLRWRALLLESSTRFAEVTACSPSDTPGPPLCALLVALGTRSFQSSFAALPRR